MNTATTIAIVVIMAALTFIAAYSFAVMNAFAQTTQSCKPSIPPAGGPALGHQQSGCGQAHKPG
jgi:hypothetical protein